MVHFIQTPLVINVQILFNKKYDALAPIRIK